MVKIQETTQKVTMEIIPAIDLLGGKCVRLNQGDYNKVTMFGSDPVKQALEWQEQGATRLHLVDLDAARTGNPINDQAIKSIAKVLKIPIQLGGGVRTLDRAEELINFGIEKVILGTIAIEEPELVKRLVTLFPNKIILGIDAKNGKVATSGWTKNSNIYAVDLVKSYSGQKIASVISTDISKDGTLLGPNIKALKDIAKASPFPIIASGGIGNMSDLLSLIPLENEGISGVILGRSLYDKKIDLKEAIKVIQGRKINDTDSNSFLYV